MRRLTQRPRFSAWIFYVVVFLILLFLILPIFIIFPLAFSSASYLTLPAPGAIPALVPGVLFAVRLDLGDSPELSGGSRLFPRLHDGRDAGLLCHRTGTVSGQELFVRVGAIAYGGAGYHCCHCALFLHLLLCV